MGQDGHKKLTRCQPSGPKKLLVGFGRAAVRPSGSKKLLVGLGKASGRGRRARKGDKRGTRFSEAKPANINEGFKN